MRLLSEVYFDWMCGLVCDRKKKQNYETLLRYLHSIPFRAIHPMDENRGEDGIDLRNRFGYLENVPDEKIERYLMGRPCSVLEMIVALAVRCEESIMDDPDYDNRTAKWFWEMIRNLGLGEMDEDNFCESYVEETIDRLLNREYGPDGEDGLFYIPGCSEDLREVEIWYQMCWYLDGVLY